MIDAAILIRVSKRTQDYERQVNDLSAIGEKRGWRIVAIIAEKITGVKGNTERDGIAELLQLCDTGKIHKVLITEVSRLGRRPSQTHQVLEELVKRKISIYISQYNIETLLPDGKLNPAASIIFAVMADMARQERETTIDRIVSGIATARKKGKIFGRRPGRLYTDQELKKKYAKPIKDLQAGISIRKVAKLHGISPDTVQRIKKVM